MGFLHRLFGKTPKDTAPLLTAPTRLFLIADSKAIGSIHILLTNNGYDVNEVSVGTEHFLIGAEREGAEADLRVVCEGVCRDGCRWVVRITMFSKPDEALQAPGVQAQLALRLQELTQALGWDQHWIIECESPEKIAA
jgi:hypothetical protein